MGQYTSWKLLKHTYAALSKGEIGREIFRQGPDEDPYDLLEKFRRCGNGVLLGTNTFWQGIDVPGAALSCVIITRLPFQVPGSPLEEARKEWVVSRGGDYFDEYALPKAITKFRQGFGRLIRSAVDKGVVIILDQRVRTKNYGNVFLSGIPSCRYLETLDGVKSFLNTEASDTY